MKMQKTKKNKTFGPICRDDCLDCLDPSRRDSMQGWSTGLWSEEEDTHGWKIIFLLIVEILRSDRRCSIWRMLRLALRSNITTWGEHQIIDDWGMEFQNITEKENRSSQHLQIVGSSGHWIDLWNLSRLQLKLHIIPLVVWCSQSSVD